MIVSWQSLITSIFAEYVHQGCTRLINCYKGSRISLWLLRSPKCIMHIFNLADISRQCRFSNIVAFVYIFCVRFWQKYGALFHPYFAYTWWGRVLASSVAFYIRSTIVASVDYRCLFFMILNFGPLLRTLSGEPPTMKKYRTTSGIVR